MAAPALAVVWPIIQQVGLLGLVSLGILSQTQADNLTQTFGTSTPTWEQLNANKAAWDAAVAGNTVSDKAIQKWSEKIGGLTAQEKELLKLSPTELQEFVDNKYKPESQRQFAADMLRDQGYTVDFSEDAQGFQVANITAPEVSNLDKAIEKGWAGTISPKTEQERRALQPYVDAGIYTQGADGNFVLNPDAALEASRAYEATDFRNTEAGLANQPEIGSADEALLAAQQANLFQNLGRTDAPTNVAGTAQTTAPAQGVNTRAEDAGLFAAGQQDRGFTPTNVAAANQAGAAQQGVPTRAQDTNLFNQGVQDRGFVPTNVAPTAQSGQAGVAPSRAADIAAFQAGQQDRGFVPTNVAPTAQTTAPTVAPNTRAQDIAAAQQAQNDRGYVPTNTTGPAGTAGAASAFTNTRAQDYGTVQSDVNLPSILTDSGTPGSTEFSNIPGESSVNFQAIIDALNAATTSQQLSEIVASAGAGWDDPGVQAAYNNALVRIADNPGSNDVEGDAGSYLVQQAQNRAQFDRGFTPTNVAQTANTTAPTSNPPPRSGPPPGPADVQSGRGFEPTNIAQTANTATAIETPSGPAWGETPVSGLNVGNPEQPAADPLAQVAQNIRDALGQGERKDILADRLIKAAAQTRDQYGRQALFELGSALISGSNDNISRMLSKMTPGSGQVGADVVDPLGDAVRSSGQLNLQGQDIARGYDDQLAGHLAQREQTDLAKFTALEGSAANISFQDDEGNTKTLADLKTEDPELYKETIDYLSTASPEQVQQFLTDTGFSGLPGVVTGLEDQKTSGPLDHLSAGAQEYLFSLDEAGRLASLAAVRSGQTNWNNLADGKDVLNTSLAYQLGLDDRKVLAGINRPGQTNSVGARNALTSSMINNREGLNNIMDFYNDTWLERNTTDIRSWFSDGKDASAKRTIHGLANMISYTRTGAQLNEKELKEVEEQYLPKWNDSPAVARDKMERLFRNSVDALEQSGLELTPELAILKAKNYDFSDPDVMRMFSGSQPNFGKTKDGKTTIEIDGEIYYYNP